MPVPESHFAEALDELSDLAAEAGLDPAAAREEGLRVAAALAEAVPGAAAGWAAVARPELSSAHDLAAVNELFFSAASQGRRWRSAPTDLLQGLITGRSSYAVDYAEHLTEVASAAVMLGTAPIWVIANASATSAAYLAAAGGTSLPDPAATGAGRFPAPSSPPSPSFPTVSPALSTRSALSTLSALSSLSSLSNSNFAAGSPGPSPSGLSPLPSGPGTDAVLRSWGYVRDPNASTPSGTGGTGGTGGAGGTAAPDPTGSVPAGSDPAGAQAGPVAATAQQTQPAPAEPAEPEKTVDQLLAELDAMIGLERVKKEIHRQVALLTVERLRVEAGLKAPKMSRHLIFVGNPGTGKTTVARLIGAIYRALKLLPTGQLIEVDRSELVAGYVGQTAMKTAEVCAKAVDGVLFIDEAYALAGDQFAQEAVNTLVKEMEDHRENLVVIVAGYPDPMVSFIAQNPGLASRFTTTIEFDDYSDDELVEILRSIASGSDYDLTTDAEKRVRMTLEASVRGPAFGNGRFSRNQFEHAVGRHAWRLKDAVKPSRDDLRLLLAHDFFDAPEPDPAVDVSVDTDPDPEAGAGPDPEAPPTPSGHHGVTPRVNPDVADAEHEAPSEHGATEPNRPPIGRSADAPASPEPLESPEAAGPITTAGAPNEDHA